MNPDYSPRRAGLKIAILLASASTLVYAFMVIVVSRRPVHGQLPSTPSAETNIVATIPYTVTTHETLGTNYIPLVSVPVTINDQTHPLNFLIDTGALITTVPASFSQNYTIDLETLPRIILSSLTTQTVFGYITPAVINLPDNQSLTLPLAFAAIDTPVLGRQGLLDRYTLTFDHQNHQIIISTN